MGEPPADEQKGKAAKVGNLTMAQWSLLGSAMAQVGCGTVAVILGALAVGLWIDTRFGTRPWATLILILGSIPLSLFIVARLAWQAARQAQQASPPGMAEDSEAVESGESGG